MSQVRFLDCTLRDGGYYGGWDFPPELVQEYLVAVKAAGVGIVEMGFRSLKNSGFKGACAYTTDEYLRSLVIPEGLSAGVMINASELVTGTSLEATLNRLFPETTETSPVRLVRIACHVHEFSEALPASKWLGERGFMVAFNLMQVADRSEEEIVALAEEAACYPLDVVYFADSMGSMDPDHTARIIGWLRQGWQGPLGIHTHDNMGTALQNTLRALDEGVTWIDSTVTGMGRGPGNARTEEVAIELADYRNEKVHLIPLMRIIRQHFKPMQWHFGWGTNPYYYLAGKYGIHPSYIQEMLNDSRYDEEDVFAVIEHLRVEGGKKFNLNTLDAARHFYKGDPIGNWRPAALLQDREILLLGSGPGVSEHRLALEAYIRKCGPLVMALNTRQVLAPELIDVCVACHPVRLLADCETHAGLPQPLITPASMLPKDVRQALAGKQLFDFGLALEPDTFGFEATHCILPKPLVVAYALATAASGKATRIVMAGFDGYGADDPRSQEMDELLELYRKTPGCLPLIAITPTRYRLNTQSVYAF